MKKLLTTLFAVFVVVSAFATVNVETITPNVYYQGACERVGTMKFIVANDQDYQTVDSANYVIVKIQLTSGATLCKNIFEDVDGNPVWGDLEVDGTFWQAGDVQGYGAAGEDTIYIKICAAPNNGTAPSSAAQAWFIIGNTESVGNAGVVFTPNAICVDFSGSTLGLNDFFYVSITDYIVTQASTGVYCVDAAPDVTGSLLGTSYSPANPAIAYGSPENSHNLVVTSDCEDKATGFANADVYLCQCYTSETTTVDQQTVTEYTCHDIYRVGTLTFAGGGCEIWLEEDSVGMLPTGSVVELSVVDAAGNPVAVYFANIPVLTTDATSGLTLSTGTGVTLVDGVGVDVASNWSDDTLYNGFDGCPDNYDECVDLFDLYEKVQYTVTAASTAGAGEIHIGDIYLGRLVSDGPVDAYIKVSWYPVPCGTGNYVVINNPLKFLDCKDEQEYIPTYYQNALYFPYFPATNGWWSGLAITNVNFYYADVVPGLLSWYLGGALGSSYYVNQDITLTLYLIEEDGDVYVYDAGTLPASGISTFLLSDPAFSPVLMSGYTDDAFGDERFWVIAVGTATVGDTAIFIDGFGMLGDGTQAQGFLPRIPRWVDASTTVAYLGNNNK